jgi:hypothetical protein
MPTSAKTLVFHIGDRKTGSTSIQDAFALKNVNLKGARVYYPAKLAHNYLKGSFKDYGKSAQSPTRGKAIKTFKGLARKIRESDADFCLVSAEVIEGIDPGVFHEVVTTYFAGAADEIRVICYTRPHAARILSSFSERVKNGNPLALNGTLETFFDHNRQREQFHYLPRYQAWRDYFGDRFLLRPMIRDQLHQGSVVADLVHHGFGHRDFQVTETNRSNQSLCLEDLMRLKVLQTHLADHPHKFSHAFGWEISRLINTLPPLETRTKLQLHKSLADDIHATYLEDARAVDREFLGGKPLLETELTNALATPHEDAQSFSPADWLAPSEIRTLNLLAALIADMTQHDQSKWTAYWRAKNLDAMRQARAAARSDKPGRRGSGQG